LYEDPTLGEISSSGNTFMGMRIHGSAQHGHVLAVPDNVQLMSAAPSSRPMSDGLMEVASLPRDGLKNSVFEVKLLYIWSLSTMPASTVLRYPATRFEPAAPVDLGARAERERLSASALKGFFNIASQWSLKDEEARELLGGVASSTFYAWKRDPQRVLDVDRITRISFLVGIYKALHILYGDPLADEWVRLPNSNALFAGRTPLQFMLSGGLLTMQSVRQLLDARRGGL
jgi:hypothetical protein